jgi:hypothetical protein
VGRPTSQRARRSNHLGSRALGALGQAVDHRQTTTSLFPLALANLRDLRWLAPVAHGSDNLVVSVIGTDRSARNA